MALPAKIQRDLDRANALLNPPQEPQVAQPVVQTPVAEATQVQPPAPTPVPAPTAPPVEDWEHKYRTLQGVHNAHTRDLKQRIGDLEAHIAQLAAQASAPATPQAPELNPQDAETFGQDLVEMVRRTAEAQSGAAARELQGRIAQLEQQLAGASAVASKTADEVFYERLAQLVPDWETVNQHEGFLASPVRPAPPSGADPGRQRARCQSCGPRLQDVPGPSPGDTEASDPAGTAGLPAHVWKWCGSVVARSCGRSEAGHHDPSRRGFLQGRAARAVAGP